MAHQAVTADAVHDGSMRDGKVPATLLVMHHAQQGYLLRPGEAPRLGKAPRPGCSIQQV